MYIRFYVFHIDKNGGKQRNSAYYNFLVITVSCLVNIDLLVTFAPEQVNVIFFCVICIEKCRAI